MTACLMELTVVHSPKPCLTAWYVLFCSRVSVYRISILACVLIFYAIQVSLDIAAEEDDDDRLVQLESTPDDFNARSVVNGCNEQAADVATLRSKWA